MEKFTRISGRRLLQVQMKLILAVVLLLLHMGTTAAMASYAQISITSRGRHHALSDRIKRMKDPGIQSSLWISGRRGGGGKNEGVACYIFKAIGGLFRRMFGVLGPLKKTTWTESFEKEFGKRHPTFIESPSLLQAANLARANCKFLIAYLPSSSARDEKKHKTFCRTLTDPEVIKMTRSSFILWSPNAGAPVLKTAAKELKAKRQPYLAVIHMGQKNKKMTIKSVHHFKPPPTPEQAVLWLNRTMEIHGHVLDEDRKEKVVRAYLVKEAKLQVEQHEEYHKALHEDRHREEREKQEAIEKAAHEAAAKKKMAEDLARRARKEADLGDEPTAGEEGLCRVAVRLPGGSKVQRAFLVNDRLEKVFDWIDVQGLNLDEQCLVRTRPKKALMYPQDKDLSIQEAGLAGQVLLLVEGKPAASVPLS